MLQKQEKNLKNQVLRLARINYKNIGTFTEYLRGRSKAAVVAPLEDQAERFILPARSDGLLLAIRKSHNDTDAEDRGRKAPRLV